jgi:hypothetical protein
MDNTTPPPFTDRASELGEGYERNFKKFRQKREDTFQKRLFVVQLVVASFLVWWLVHIFPKG